MSWHDLSGFQRDLLHAIAAHTHGDTPDIPYGLALKRWLTDRYAVPVNHSRLYQNLDTLVEQDLVRCGTVDDRTNRYDLTPAGRRCLADYAATLSAVAPNAPAPEADADIHDHTQEPELRSDGGHALGAVTTPDATAGGHPTAETPATASTQAQQWRLRYVVGDLDHYTAWTDDFATVETLYHQYRRSDYGHDITIERRTEVPP